jgi:hypothetical protein
MDPSIELAALRQELAALRREINYLREFINIETDDAGEPWNMTLRCGAIQLRDPHQQGASQMFLSASEDGPTITLDDAQEKNRLILSVDQGGPRLDLLTAEMKQGVVLHADQQRSLGYAAVFEKGEPRAIIKPGEDGAGFLSAVHTDGKIRIGIRSTEASGELIAVNADLKPTIRMHSETALGGGQIVINHGNGKAALILTDHRQLGGVVLAHGPDGQPSASVPDAGFERKGGEG